MFTPVPFWSISREGGGEEHLGLHPKKPGPRWGTPRASLQPPRAPGGDITARGVWSRRSVPFTGIRWAIGWVGRLGHRMRRLLIACLIMFESCLHPVRAESARMHVLVCAHTKHISYDICACRRGGMPERFARASCAAQTSFGPVRISVGS